MIIESNKVRDYLQKKYPRMDEKERSLIIDSIIGLNIAISSKLPIFLTCVRRSRGGVGKDYFSLYFIRQGILYRIYTINRVYIPSLMEARMGFGSVFVEKSGITNEEAASLISKRVSKLMEELGGDSFELKEIL